MSKKIKNEQKKFLGETLNQYDKALDEAINQLDKKNREQNHKISSLVNSFDNEYLEKDVEGNMTTLENSKDGMVIINEIQGSTEVNYCKDGEKELILNGDIDTQGKSFVTLTEGVDSGLVDVSLEGNTEINLSKTKDPVLVTREFDDINCNAGKLQYTIDDVTTINDEPGKVDIDRIVGDTMVNHAVNGSEELILNAHINESGDNNITFNGVTSDGGKVDVALEGNTLVNVSKTKDSTAITKAYTVENSGNHIALQGNVDGSCRPVVTGNTLVNLIDIKGNENISGNTVYSKVTDTEFIFDWSKGQAYNNWIQVRNNVDLIQEGKTYTVIINILENNPTLDGVEVNGEILLHTWFNGFNIVSQYIPYGTTGLYKYTFSAVRNSTQTLNMIGIRVNSKADDVPGSAILMNGGKLRISRDILVLEGNYTNKPIPDYFEGLQSSFEDNLVTQEMVDSGEEEESNLGKYKVEYKSTQEDGTVGSTKTLYLNSPLLEGDTIEEKNGSVYHIHRYTKVVLDGNNNIEGYPLSEDYPDVIGFYIQLDDIKGVNFFIDKYSNTKNALQGRVDINYEAISVSQNFIKMTILKSKLDTVNLNGIKSYLQNNPITIVYDLKTPTYELIEQSNLVIPSYANGHLDFDTAVPVEKVDFLPFSEELTYLYANTQYTIQFVSDKATTADITLGGTPLLAQNIVTGLNRISITTPSELVDNKLIINGVGANISEVVVTDTNREFRYFEGMKSVGEGGNLVITSSNSDNSQSNTQQLTHEPLRAVGDYRDRYVLVDGKWYIERRCREYTIPQNTVWTKTNMVSNNGKYTRYYFIMDSIITDQLNASNYENFAISELLPFGYSNSWGICNRNEIQIINNSTEFYVQLDKTTVEEVASLMNGSKIIYRLKTPVYEEIDYNPFEVYPDVTHISVNPTIPCNVTVKNHGYNMVALKENTQYTLYVNKNTTNALTYRLGDYVEINSLSKFTFTTPSTLTNKTLRIDGKGTKVNDLMLIEGTPTNDSIGYFDGLKSSYECEQVTDESDENYGKYKVDIKVVGKNLFDKNKFINAELCTFNGIECVKVQDTNKYFKYYDNFKYNTQYTLTLKVYREEGFINRPFTVYAKYTDGTETKFSFNHLQLKSVTTKENKTISSITGDWMFSGNIYIDLSVAQLEEGTQATDYEPYFESIQTIYLNSPLLKGDEIVWKDNKIQYYHKMETIVLDGSDDEDWAFRSNSDGYSRFYRDDNTLALNPKILCDTLNAYSTLSIAWTGEGIGGHSNSHEFRLYLKKHRLTTQDVTGLKQWLQQNPVTVAYQLAEPYYEEISDYPLKLNAIANSSLSTESTIQVTNISFNVYEETLPYLYPNTKYYITFNADVDRNNIVIDLGGSHTVLDCKVGFNKVEITTPSDTTNLLTFSGTGVNIDHVKVTQQDIDEYFEGMKSVGECEELEVISTNSDNTLSNTQQLTHEPLRAVGDVKDRYVLIDGKWYIERNCMKFTFNGSDNGRWSATGYGGHETRNTFEIGIIVPRYPNALKSICDTYITEEVNDIPINDNAYRIGNTVGTNSSAYYFLFTPSTSIIPYRDLNAWKEYLSENPITIIVECSPSYEPIDYNPFEVYEDTTHITANSLIPTNVVVKNHGYNCILKPSTKYTVALNKPNGTISAKLGGSAKVDSTNSIFTITTPSTLNDNILRLSGSGNVKDIMILEGDKTVNTPSYFEGIESVFEQEYDTEKGKYRVTAKVVGKNLFKFGSSIKGGVITLKNEDGTPILKAGTYTISSNCEKIYESSPAIALYKSSGKPITIVGIKSGTTFSSESDIITIYLYSNGANYIESKNKDYTFSNIQIEEGNIATTYEPYKESNVTFYINEPLREVENNKDRIFIKDGKLVVQRNCGHYIFNENTPWIGSDHVNKGHWIRVSDNSIPNYKPNLNPILSIPSVSSPMGYPYWQNKDNEIEIFWDWSGTHMYIFLHSAKTKWDVKVDYGVDDISNYMKNNPIEMVYELAEPVYEEVDCDLSKLVLENYENSSLIFESNIPVSANIKYSGEVPVVTQAKALSSKVDNTTFDINENIIPYMCDIDYRIVELQLMNGDTQGEDIELLGIGDIEILGNENVLFNNREDKKYNYSYDMLKRDILSQRYSKEEYQYRLDRYLLAKKISDEEYKELEGLLNNGE